MVSLRRSQFIIIFVFLILFILTICTIFKIRTESVVDNYSKINETNQTEERPKIDSKLPETLFVKRNNNYLIFNGSKLILKGINLDAGRVDIGHGDWQFNCPYSECRPIYDELWSEEDYQKIKRIGFNSVRLMLNYMYFEDDINPYTYKQKGFDWLDKHVLWAKNNGLFLILDMHVPQGGIQTSEFEDRIWDSKQNQERLIGLWKEIAKRYNDEKTIGGYNLLNEPQPKISCNPWKELSSKIISSIRTVDKNHLIIVEKCNWIREVRNYDGYYKNIHPNWQFLVNDENVMYDFHFYMPQEFTLQCYPEIECPSGLNYPDENYQIQSIDGRNFVFNKEYLENEINTLLEFSQRNNVPASIGEWAPGPATFKKGGEEYILDLKDIFNDNNLSWIYFDYWTIHTDNTLSGVKPVINQMFD